MTVDTILMVVEVGLLIWVVVQGEYVRFYEREVYRMNRERYQERAEWRKQKRQQQSKKETAPKTSGSTRNSESLSNSSISVEATSATDANVVEAPSTPTDLPTLTTSISK